MFYLLIAFSFGEPMPPQPAVIAEYKTKQKCEYFKNKMEKERIFGWAFACVQTEGE